MAIGFNTTSSFGNRTIVPDKGLSNTNEPRIFLSQFGDGYEQRVNYGLNPLVQTFRLSFITREKEEIDDIVGFFESTNGVTKFDYTFSDTNESGNEQTIKVVCENWSQTWAYDNYYSLQATFRRVYEP